MGAKKFVHRLEPDTTIRFFLVLEKIRASLGTRCHDQILLGAEGVVMSIEWK